MANSFTSNTTKQIAEAFTESFVSEVVLSKSVDNQILTPKLTPKSGGLVSIRRPTDYVAIRTAGGDLNGASESDIVVGSANATVQDYITTWTTWDNIEEALEMDDLDELIKPMAQRIVTTLETSLGAYMYTNAALHYGTPGEAVNAWSDVAGAGALMDTLGVPKDAGWHYAMNPFTTTALADAQGGLSSGSNNLVDSAWNKAQISSNFGGMSAISSNALASYTTGTLSAGANRAGAIVGTPSPTYPAHKDTMIQSIDVDGFGAGSDTIKAGEIVEVTGVNRINMSTRDAVVGLNGNQILWSGVVTQDVTLSSGTGTLLVAGPAIFESGEAFNTVDAVLANDQVITIINPAASTVTQPNLFYHKKAFGIGFVKLPKLYDTDTIATSKDGFSLRVTRYSDGTRNEQRVRIDMLPAFVTFNPFFAGQGFGVP